MKALFPLLFSLLLLSSNNASDYKGRWLMIDEEGTKKSVIKLYTVNGLMYGDIIYLFPKPGRSDNPICDKCSDDRKGKHWVGMQVIRGMTWDGQGYSKGTILDPKTGRTFEAKFVLSHQNKDIMIVKAFLGPLYRTQSWLRVPED